MSKSEHLSTAQVAAALNVSVATVNRWAAAGKLRIAVQFPGPNGARLFRQSDVERLAEKMRDAESVA